MAIVGIYTDRKNPEFTKCDFTLWMPQFTKFLDTDQGDKYFNKLYTLANSKIFKSIYGEDWELAMSYCIAHYLTIIARQMEAPAGSDLMSIAGGGVQKGVMSNATVGSFNVTYSLDQTNISEDEAKFWNQTSYGAQLMALLKTKSVASIMVVTNGSAVPPKRGGWSI